MESNLETKTLEDQIGDLLSQGYTVERTAELLDITPSRIFSSRTYRKGFGKYFGSILPKNNFRSSADFENYESLAKAYQKKLADIKYQTRLGKWNPLGIDLEQIYYERTSLFIRPVLSQEGMDFKDDSFRDDVVEHFEFLLEEFDVEGEFEIDHTGTNRYGVTPLVSIGSRSVEDRAFLAAYWLVLRQDVRGDLFSWGSPTRSSEIISKNQSRKVGLL